MCLIHVGCTHVVINRSMACIPMAIGLVLNPTTINALLRQGTWLTRPDPRPQIESTIAGFLIDRWSYIALANCSWAPQLCAGFIKPFSWLGCLRSSSFCVMVSLSCTTYPGKPEYTEEKHCREYPKLLDCSLFGPFTKMQHCSSQYIFVLKQVPRGFSIEWNKTSFKLSRIVAKKFLLPKILQYKCIWIASWTIHPH